MHTYIMHVEYVTGDLGELDRPRKEFRPNDRPLELCPLKLGVFCELTELLLSDIGPLVSIVGPIIYLCIYVYIHIYTYIHEYIYKYMYICTCIYRCIYKHR
jgi:hypothetical protein